MADRVKYRGMFVVGKLVNPDHPDWVCVGARDYIGQPLVIRDRGLVGS